MKDHRKEYFSNLSEQADRDYLLARLTHRCGTFLYSRVGYLGQQALEKYLKAFLIQEKKDFPEAHDLFEIAERASNFDDRINKDWFKEVLEIFDVFREIGRYGPFAKYDPNRVDNEKRKSYGKYQWISSNLDKLDRAALTVRQNLDFNNTHNHANHLKLILDGEDDQYLYWEISSPRDILIKGNEHLEKI